MICIDMIIYVHLVQLKQGQFIDFSAMEKTSQTPLLFLTQYTFPGKYLPGFYFIKVHVKSIKYTIHCSVSPRKKIRHVQDVQTTTTTHYLTYLYQYRCKLIIFLDTTYNAIFSIALYALERTILSLFLDRNLQKIVFFLSNHCVTGSNEHEILIYVFNLKSPARELY